MSDPRESLLSRWGHIQEYLLPWLREELEPCTEALERFIIVLDTIGLEAYVRAAPSYGRGRKPEDRRALARAFVGKAVLGLPTTAALIERLTIDKAFRRICGWETRREVPSEATFSRAFAEFANGQLPDHLHEALVKRSLGERVVGCVARDATEIEAREKPVKKDDPPPQAAPPRKRGRPRKGEERPKDLTRIERQTSQNLQDMLDELPAICNIGCKTNSKGHTETWHGYKLHIDVANGQIPVSCILTSASVHDSQVAIPLMTLTGQRITYLYEVMDSAYAARTIVEHGRSLGHVPVVDPNFRTHPDLKAEARAEIARRAFIHMPDPGHLIYNFRTMAERINARLKDEFGGRYVRVRGAVKVKCHLMFGMLALTVDQIYRAFSPDPAPA
jgi:hypothetical protein